MCRVALEHEDPTAFSVLFREHGTASVSMAPGITGASFRAQPTPVGRAEAFFVPADEVPVTVSLGDRTEVVVRADTGLEGQPPPLDPMPALGAPPDTEVRLEELAWVRSGDKGDTANVGVIARRPELLPSLAAALDEPTVARWYAHWFGPDGGQVRRFLLPGPNALNLLLDGALGGGCNVSLSFDPFGKSLAQELLDLPVAVPRSLLGAG